MDNRYLAGLFATPAADEGSPDATYLALCREHRIAVQECPDCGRSQFPPELICRHCQSDRVDWVDIEPRGVVFSWTRVWHPSTPAVSEKVPYLVAVVEVGRPGARFVGNILGDPLQEVRIGDAVTTTFEDDAEAGVTLIQWTLANQENE